MDQDIMEVAERVRVEGYRSIWTPAKPTGRGGISGENDGNDQTTLEILQVFGRLWDLAEPLKRWGWTPIFSAF